VKAFPNMRRGAFGTVLLGASIAAVAPAAGADSVAYRIPTYGTVTGRIVDMMSKLPISAATITIGRIVSVVAVSDKGGFVIRNVPTGTHELRIDTIGWKRYTTSVTVNPDQATDIGIIGLTSTISGQ
jgi:hypothetical protein